MLSPLPELAQRLERLLVLLLLVLVLLDRSSVSVEEDEELNISGEMTEDLFRLFENMPSSLPAVQGPGGSMSIGVKVRRCWCWCSLLPTAFFGLVLLVLL